MKLISARIENFGKLSDVSFDFSEHCQIFCKENGWGKSTLAAFLCVMFYGFDGEKKRDELVNERKRYQPWQKGTYGGSVVFAVGGKSYVSGKKRQKTSSTCAVWIPIWNRQITVRILARSYSR